MDTGDTNPDARSLHEVGTVGEYPPRRSNKT
jgi:hypothetical protein